MLVKEITYKDFNDQTRKEKFYFNLTDKELIELELSESGGMTAVVKLLQVEKDPKKIFDIFCRIVDWAYGEKTADGRFPKSPEILDRFKSTQAYSDLVMDILEDQGNGGKFIAGLVSAERLAAAQAAAAAESNGAQPSLLTEPDGIIVSNPDPEIEQYRPSRAMSLEEMKAEIARLEAERQ